MGNNNQLEARLLCAKFSVVFLVTEEQGLSSECQGDFLDVYKKYWKTKFRWGSE